MTESFKTPENIPITDGEVIEALKTKGVEDSEAKDLLLRWTDQLDKQVQEIYNDSPEDHRLEVNQKEMLKACLRRAEVYLEAGYLDAAYDMLAEWGDQGGGSMGEIGARIMASQIGDQELASKVDSLLEKIEEKYREGE